MIDPNWNVVDLDPVTWRNLGPYFNVAQYVRAPATGEAELYILHEDGRVLKAHDTQAGNRRDIVPAQIDDPQETARVLFETENWSRVHVINKRHLAAVARRAQQIENRPLTLDAYYHQVFTSLWQDSQGYVSWPPRPPDWHGWTYADVQAFIQRLPDPATVALGVLEDGAIFVGLILEVRGGLVRTVTTFEALTLPGPLRVSAPALVELEQAINAKFAPLAAALLCDRVVFEGWIQAPDKSTYLQAAVQQGVAFWRLQFAPAP